MAKETSNLKDTLSTVCGILLAISGGLLASGVVLPNWLKTVAGVTVVVSGAIIGYLTGKAPNATMKAPEVVADQNTENKEAKEVK